jgi:PQQ-dependent catabolism-associated CXXCW motif protein
VDAPKHIRGKGTVKAGELRVDLEDGATVRVRKGGDATLDATWTREGRTSKAELRRIADDPAAGSVAFAQEDRDFGARPTRYLEVPHPSKPLPLLVPGVTTISTLQLRDLMEKDKTVVLIDAFRDADHMTIPGAFWRPDIGEVRPGAFPLAEMAKILDVITNHDHERALVVFERSSNWGWYGYNAALRLVGMGYTNVHWYRGGIDAWFDAGYQMAKVSARRVAAP